MPEADPEDRNCAEQAVDRIDGIRHLLGIAWTVRQEHALRIARQHVGRGRGCGHDLDGGQRSEVAQDRALDAEVVGHHAQRAVADRVRLGRRHSGDEVDARCAGLRGRGGLQCGLVGRAERAGHRPGVADVASEATGVDAGDSSEAVRLQERLEVAVAAPVAAPPSEIAHDHAAAERLATLAVVVRHAVVADVRIREGDDLARVRRVGDHLLVAGEHRVEHDLARADAVRRLGPDGFAFERRAVGQHEQRFLQRVASPSRTTGSPHRNVCRTRPVSVRPA